MQQILKIPEKLITLNPYIDEERKHWSNAATLKKSYTEIIWSYCKQQRLKSFEKPIAILYVWLFNNWNADSDNISFAKKVINDGLEMAQVVKKDSLKYIRATSDIFVHSKTKQGLFVIMNELEDDYDCSPESFLRATLGFNGEITIRDLQ